LLLILYHKWVLESSGCFWLFTGTFSGRSQAHRKKKSRPFGRAFFTGFKPCGMRQKASTLPGSHRSRISRLATLQCYGRRRKSKSDFHGRPFGSGVDRFPGTFHHPS